MATKVDDSSKPNGAPPAGDPDEDFFTAEGVTDPDERNAIRARERVMAYHEYRKKKAEAKPKGKGKRWFDD